MSTFTLDLYPELFQAEHEGWTAYYVTDQGRLVTREILGWMSRKGKVVPLVFGDTALVPAESLNSNEIVFAEFRQAGSETVLGMTAGRALLHWFVRAQFKRVGKKATWDLLSDSYGEERGSEIHAWATRPYRDVAAVKAA
jgi:hypothetical protein